MSGAPLTWDVNVSIVRHLHESEGQTVCGTYMENLQSDLGPFTLSPDSNPCTGFLYA